MRSDEFGVSTMLHHILESLVPNLVGEKLKSDFVIIRVFSSLGGLLITDIFRVSE